MASPVRVVSVHNFLYSDRHRKFYPDIKVYLEGDQSRIVPFMLHLRNGKSPEEIRDALDLEFRGDVLYATLVAHFFARDGLLPFPDWKFDVPSELLEEMPRCEAEWQAAQPLRRASDDATDKPE